MPDRSDPKDGREDRPSEREIEQRRQVRAGLRVERAVNEPGGRPAPVKPPHEGEKECAP